MKKLNNKGFAVTIILYGTLVLFLLLLVSMLGILSTYRLRLEKIIDDVEPPILEEEQKLTCNFTTSISGEVVGVSVTVNDKELLHETPYSYYSGGEWYKNTSMVSNTIKNGGTSVYFTIRVRDKKGNEVKCGTASFYVSSFGYYDNNLTCTNTYAVPPEDKVFGGSGGGLSGSYTTAEAAMSACKNKCPSPQYTYKSGCGLGKRIARSINREFE